MRSRIEVYAQDGKTLLFTRSRSGAERLLSQAKAAWLQKGVSLIVLVDDLDIRNALPLLPSKRLYGNFKVLSPDGLLMFRCNKDKVDWYVSRGLAEVQEGDVVRLLFNPKGQGHARDSDPFYLLQKENRCVVCGVEEMLSHHHVVPKCYRKHMPENVKNYCHHDVLLLCMNCHSACEQHAVNLKMEISRKYDVPLGGIGASADRGLVTVWRSASALHLHGDVIPEDRKQVLLGKLKAFYGKEDVTEQDIAAAMTIMKSRNKSSDYKSYGKAVMEKVEDVEEFVKTWRRHFLETMKPEYLPKYWNVDRTVCRGRVDGT